MMEPRLVNEVKINRSYIPRELRANFIKSVLRSIEDLKREFNAFSYFHLKYLLTFKQNNKKVVNVLKKTIKGGHEGLDEEYAKYLFNVILDSHDSIGGGTIKQIYSKYHIYLPNYKEILFQGSNQFCNRFKINDERSLQKIAEDIVTRKISHSYFKNLVDPHIQVLKEYFRDNFTSKSKNLKSIFPQEIIRKSFVQRFLNLSEVTLRKIFLDAHLEHADVFSLTKKMEQVNMKNEIRLFIVYTLLKDDESNPSRIARIAGISRKTVLRYGRELNKLTNPLTNLPFIDYDTKFSRRTRTQSSLLRKSKMSHTGYVLSMSIEKRRGLIKGIKKIIDQLLLNHEYPYFLNKFLKIDNQTSQDSNLVASKLVKLSRIDNKLTYSDCSELFYIMLEFYDYIEIKPQLEIAKEFKRYGSFIQRLAKLILPSPEEYKNRFPSDMFSKQEKLHIADKVLTGQITNDNVSRIDSFEFQQILKVYRNHVVKVETDILVKRGYPSIGSRKYNERVRYIRQKNLFPRYCLGGEFIDWIESLDESKLAKIIKPSHHKDIKRNILLMSNEINQNREILKYIIYLILKSHDSLKKIAKQSGKTRHVIRSIGKLLDLSTSPITNTFYIKSYDDRFLKND